jgi:hypothetical protein
VGTREKTAIGWKERKEGAECAMKRERETIEHMWNRCSKMREREGKQREEILNEDGQEIRWMKEIWKRREMIEKERGIVICTTSYESNTSFHEFED